jgi:plastocyanin
VDNRFEPRSLAVPVGTTVTWRSRGINLHTTTSFGGLWDSGNTLPGGTFSFTFSNPGTYSYFCRQHALNGQVGMIVVQ